MKMFMNVNTLYIAIEVTSKITAMLQRSYYIAKCFVEGKLYLGSKSAKDQPILFQITAQNVDAFIWAGSLSCDIFFYMRCVKN